MILEKKISPWLGLEPTKMINSCYALFFPSRIRRIIFSRSNAPMKSCGILKKSKVTLPISKGVKFLRACPEYILFHVIQWAKRPYTFWTISY